MESNKGRWMTACRGLKQLQQDRPTRMRKLMGQLQPSWGSTEHPFHQKVAAAFCDSTAPSFLCVCKSKRIPRALWFTLIADEDKENVCQQPDSPSAGSLDNTQYKEGTKQGNTTPTFQPTQAKHRATPNAQRARPTSNLSLSTLQDLLQSSTEVGLPVLTSRDA